MQVAKKREALLQRYLSSQQLTSRCPSQETDLLRMELVVLAALDWQPTGPTAHTFLQMYAQASPSCDAHVMSLATYFAVR